VLLSAVNSGQCNVVAREGHLVSSSVMAKAKSKKVTSQEAKKKREETT
jgi:hypothetical protein